MHRNPLIGCKSNKSFLGHSDSSFKMLETAKNARNVMQRRTPPGYKSEVKAFPEDKINELLWEGFKMTNKKNDLSFLEIYNWRDIAITILMHGGGIRHSEDLLPTELSALEHTDFKSRMVSRCSRES